MIHRPGSPTRQISEWLSRFGAALDRKDRAAAAELFADECYWRDLISFTWNIKTLEGKDEPGVPVHRCSSPVAGHV